MACKRTKKVLAVGDLHAPFMHPDAVDFLYALNKKEKPDEIVFLGDIADQHALSRFTRDPTGYSMGHEFEAAALQLAPLYDVFPTARVCWGNHDTRVYDRAAEIGIPGSAIASMHALIGCPRAWRWADEWRIDGVTYEHGTNWSGRDAHVKAANAQMAPVVIGHIHAHAGINYVSNKRHLFWGFNVGCLIDSKQYAFHYAKRNPARAIIGVGIIDRGVPRFHPMHLGRDGRWTGAL